MRFISLFIALLSFHVMGSAQPKLVCFEDDPHLFIPEKLVDYTHISANLKISAEKREVTAEVVLSFNALRTEVDSVVLYCPNFSFSEILLNKQQVQWYQHDHQLIVKLPRRRKPYQAYQLSLSYRAQPQTELFFIGWDGTTHTMRRQIWAHRPYHWLPYASDRLKMDFKITFDSHYKVFSNGVRKGVKKNKDGTSTWHYSMQREHPFFSTALVIGDYRWKSFVSTTGVPVELWYYPDRESHVETTYMLMDEMLRFCEEEFGMPYPYEVYRQAPVADYLYAGMETTTSTIFGDYLHIDGRAFWERNYVNVNVHELIHQWIGNYVSHLRHSDVWLTESFATFYAKLFERKYFGELYYQWERVKEYNRVMNASATDNYAIAHSRGGVDRWYPKGSLVLDMLYDELGEDDFRRAIKHYLHKHANSEVWTPDLKKAIYEATGKSMDRFFDQWIERGGEPHYRIQYEDHGPNLLVKVEQIQEVTPERPLFDNELIFESFYIEGSRKQHRFRHYLPEHLYVIHKESTLLFLAFDPGMRLLKKETYIRDVHDQFDQIINKGRLIDRYRAILDVKSIAVEDKREVLATAARELDHPLIWGEVLLQLAQDENDTSKQLFAEALASKEVMSRRAALENIHQTHKNLLPEIVSCLSDTSYSNAIIALRKLSIIDAENIHSHLNKTRQEKGFPGLNFRIAWLQTAIEHGKQEHLSELIDYSSLRFDFRTRINAIEALKNLNYLDESFASHLVQASNHWNFRLSAAAKLAISELSVSASFKEMIERVATMQLR
jgi:aminopeptidase N